MGWSPIGDAHTVTPTDTADRDIPCVNHATEVLGPQVTNIKNFCCYPYSSSISYHIHNCRHLFSKSLRQLACWFRYINCNRHIGGVRAHRNNPKTDKLVTIFQMEAIRGGLHCHSGYILRDHLCDLRKLDPEAITNVSHLTEDGRSRSSSHDESQHLVALRQHCRAAVALLRKRCADHDVQEPSIGRRSPATRISEPEAGRWVNDLTNRPPGGATHDLHGHTSADGSPNSRGLSYKHQRRFNCTNFENSPDRGVYLVVILPIIVFKRNNLS